MQRRPLHADDARRPPDRPLTRPRAAPARRLPPFRRSHCLALALGLGLFVVVAAVFYIGAWQQALTSSVGGRDVPWIFPDGRTPARTTPGGAVRFRPSDLVRRLEERGRWLERERSEREREGRRGVRAPRVALVVGNINDDPQSLMLLTLVRSLRELGYLFTVYALEEDGAYSLWEHVGVQVGSEISSGVDWSSYEGVILSSLEAGRVISSLMQDPFYSVPLIWMIQEDFLGKRLPAYESWGWEDLINDWRSMFCRANVVVFPDFSLPMMYTSLDSGNFYVIPESPINVWEAESYLTSHSRDSLRKEAGYNENDLIILVIGSYFFYDELPWGYEAIINSIAPEINKITRMKGLGGSFKFAFLCGNSGDAHDSSFQELASNMGLPVGSTKHYGMDGDVDSVILMADIVLYGSLQEEQSFPPLLVRAMSFGNPIIAPNLTIITKYVNPDNGFIFYPREPDTLAVQFSSMVVDEKLSTLAHSVASHGKSLSRNMFALDCISDYAKLLEHVLQFPSDVILPHDSLHTKQNYWAWDLLEKVSSHTVEVPSIVDILENRMAGKPIKMENTTQVAYESPSQDFPSQSDWDDLREMEIAEDIERREMEELKERTERNLGSWEDVYRNAKKADRMLKFEPNERDEGELERTGRQLCIYEICSGEGTWSFLHHGSLYRGISLSKRARRSRSDDVDAISRLPILNDTYYRDRLCETGAMFSIANKVDSIHNTPWIGFQSWRAAARKVLLSVKAEEILEETIQMKTTGDVIYYWAIMDMDHNDGKESIKFDFWSMCDILNAGNCRTVFEDAFRLMYGLPENIVALPPMPADGDQWSSLHSWVMPTSSFLEFVMFSRMFVDSIDNLNHNNNNTLVCLLGSSELEKKHCYCRVLELLVNVWAFHSARRMVYLDPVTGVLKEQHPLEQRTGMMWVKYFNSTLLKNMDLDLAEEADDGMHPSERWLWPSTGEVYWSGILLREREERYRQKMDKKRKNKEKLLERQKHGYRQKSLGGNR